MGITLKPLTAIVTQDGDVVSIVVKNDAKEHVLGPLPHHQISERGINCVNDHIAQLIHNGMNIVNLETTVDGVSLPQV